MAVTNATFRTHYPEFSNVVVYPNGQIDYWIANAALLLSVDRWGTLLDLGTELLVAHNIAIEARAQDEATNGEIPGTTTGPVNSKSVDKVSVGFDTGAATEERGGHYNLTIYGTRLLRLMKQIGMGPLQIGLGGPVPPLSSADAWGYPWYVTPNPSN